MPNDVLSVKSMDDIRLKRSVGPGCTSQRRPRLTVNFARRPPVVLRVDREVLLGERRRDVGARPNPPDAGAKQHPGGVDAALCIGGDEIGDAAARGHVLEVEVATLVRERRRHRH